MIQRVAPPLPSTLGADAYRPPRLDPTQPRVLRVLVLKRIQLTRISLISLPPLNTPDWSYSCRVITVSTTTRPRC